MQYRRKNQMSPDLFSLPDFPALKPQEKVLFFLFLFKKSFQIPGHILYHHHNLCHAAVNLAEFLKISII